MANPTALTIVARVAARIALVAAATLVLLAVVIAPAVARPITGSVRCTLMGAAAFSPGLPLNSPGPATKKLRTKITFTGTLSHCTGAQTNTKQGLQIDGGTVSAKGQTRA